MQSQFHHDLQVLSLWTPAMDTQLLPLTVYEITLQTRPPMLHVLAETAGKEVCMDAQVPLWSARYGPVHGTVHVQDTDTARATHAAIDLVLQSLFESQLARDTLLS